MRFYLKTGIGTDRTIYYVCWTDSAGRGHRKTTSTSDAAAAQLKLAQAILEHDRPRDLRPETTTLLEVLLHYQRTLCKDARRDLPFRYCLANVVEHLDGTTVAGFDDAAQRTYVRNLAAEGQSSATINRRLAVLVAALNQAVRSGMLASAPTVLRAPSQHTGEGARPFTVEELRALFTAARTYNERAMVLLWTTTLCRPGALLDLTWDRVDFAEPAVDYRVPGAIVTRKRRAKVVIAPTVAAWLKEHAGTGLVVRNSKTGAPLSDFDNHAKRVIERASLTGSAYGFRKGGVTYLANSGVTELVYKTMLGHKPTSGETWRYVKAQMNRAMPIVEDLLAEINAPWLPRVVASGLRVPKPNPLKPIVGANDP